MPKFSSVGEVGPPCLSPAVPPQCCSWESRLPWWKVLPGTCRTSQVLLHLSAAMWGSRVPSSSCHVCLCAQCWGNTAPPVPPAGQQSLLAGHHVSGTEEGLRSRVWQLAAGLGWAFWRRNAAQHPGKGLCRVWVICFVTTENLKPLCHQTSVHSGNRRNGELCLRLDNEHHFLYWKDVIFTGQIHSSSLL